MRLALAQLLVEGGEPERNFERASALVKQAADGGADLVLLPETIDFAWTHPSSLKEAKPIPGPYTDYFANLARTHQLYILVGLTERTDQCNYNVAVLFDRSGEMIHCHRKINLLEVEFPFYEVGQSLSVIDTEFGKIGINVCADNYIDSLHLGHALARMGAQIILSPSSWTVDYSIHEGMDPYMDKWLKPFQILASYYNIIVASTSSVGYIVGGPYEGKKKVGCSLVVNKDGVVAKGKFNEFAGDLKIVDIELSLRTDKGTQIGAMLTKRGLENDELI